MQQQGVITIQKPYLGWIPTQMGSITNFYALESTTGITSESVIQFPPPLYQDYAYSQNIMVNRPGFEGHISPGPGFVAVTDGSSIINGLALNAVNTPDGYTVSLLDNNKSVSFLSGGTTITNSVNVYGTQVGFVSGTTHSYTTVNGDICLYPNSNTPTSANYYIFASWEDSTTNKGDIASLPSAATNTNTPNYYTGLGGTTLFYGVPHPLCVGIDRNVYFGNGAYVGKFNPITSAFADIALQLVPGFIIQGLATYQDYLAIIAYKINNYSTDNPLIGSTAKMFLWDGIQTSWNFQYDLQDNFVSNILNDGKNLYVITYGRNGTTKLKQFNGESFDILCESALNGGYPGGQTQPNPCSGAMDMWLNHIVWSTNGSNPQTSAGQAMVNAYGSPAEQYPRGLHNWSTMNSANLAVNGMCKNLYGRMLYLGHKDGNTYTLQLSDLTQYATATFCSPIIPLPTNSTITYVKLYPSAWPDAGASVKVAIIPNQNSIVFGSSPDVLQWTATAGTNTFYLQNSQTIDNVNSFSLDLSFNINTATLGTIIRKVEVGFSYDTNNI